MTQENTGVKLENGTVAYCEHALRDRNLGEIIAPDQIPLCVDATKLGIMRGL